MTRTWIKNATIVTLDELNRVLQGHVVIEGNLISYVGTDRPDEQQSFDETIDGSGKLIMPGFVNTHCHAAMSLLRGIGDDLALQVWLETKMWPNEAKFTGNHVRIGTSLSVLEMIKGGTTSFVDMYDHMDEVAKVVDQSGMRACLTRGMIGHCPPEEAQAKIRDATEFAKAWNGKANGRITVMMSPHAAYTCPPAFIEQVVQVAHDLQLPIHSHMSETAREVEENVRDYGLRPVAHLDRLGVFSRPCLVAHGVHLNDEEIDLLAERGVGVSHNPGSNLKLASGIARLPEMLKRGIRVSLGTDSAASNNNLDMFEEVRLAALIHKGVSGDPTAIPAGTALRLGTTKGAESIWLSDVGAISTGMKADLIAIDLNQPHLQPMSDVISHIVYSASAKDVSDVCIDGTWVVRNGECLTMDEEKIMYEAGQCFKSLMEQS